MGTFDFTEKVAMHESRVKDNLDKMGSMDLWVPGSAEVSGSRKILASTQRQAVLSIMSPEPPIIQTGYENEFGRFSASIEKAKTDYQVVAKISKYSFSPNHHYWLILKDLHSNMVSVIERIAWKHRTEKYGYLYNNTYLDSLNINDKIRNGQVMRSSLAYDEFGNRCDGVNLNVLYIALDQNMEDSIVISNEAAAKLTAPLVKKIDVIINENDIPINYYGNTDIYKPMPDIGEHTKDAILIALRKENKENALFSQSVERLKCLGMNDTKYLVHGTVVDIDVCCNNPENLNNYSSAQFKLYYNELKRYSQEFINVVTPLQAAGCELTDELIEYLAVAKQVVNGNKYMDKKEFSNLEIRITVLEELPLNVGDKISNRFGGKGVVSKKVPQKLMPRTEDGVYADILFNQSTMMNRENPFQVDEQSLTRIGQLILRYIRDNNIDPFTAMNMIKRFIAICNPTQAEKIDQWISEYNEDDNAFLVQSLIMDDFIYQTVETMHDVITIDDLAKIYEEFPFLQQSVIYVPIVDSKGNYRYIPSRRRAIIGKEYILRLKQYAEEKFSATSLSSTNIRNENAKSKANREYRSLYSHTPIRVGEMESNSFNHVGPEKLIEVMLLHSLSPHARHLVEQFSTGDPYVMDIKLDHDCTNRSAEIVQTYLKSIGLKLVFKKVKKNKVNPYKKHHAMHFDQFAKKNPFIYMDTEGLTKEEILQKLKEREEYKKDAFKRYKEGKLKDPFIAYDRPLGAKPHGKQ
jgi:DNA-directed RNA polymerase beta subunit